MFRRAKKRKSSQTGIFRFFPFMPIWEYLPSKMSLCEYFPVCFDLGLNLTCGKTSWWQWETAEPWVSKNSLWKTIANLNNDETPEMTMLGQDFWQNTYFSTRYACLWISQIQNACLKILLFFLILQTCLFENIPEIPKSYFQTDLFQTLIENCWLPN